MTTERTRTELVEKLTHLRQMVDIGCGEPCCEPESVMAIIDETLAALASRQGAAPVTEDLAGYACPYCYQRADRCVCKPSHESAVETFRVAIIQFADEAMNFSHGDVDVFARDLARRLAALSRSAPTPPSPWTRATEDVLAERAKQDRKWGEQNHDPFTYLTVLIEEVGEFAQAALHLRFGGEAAAGFRKEAVQTAAVALAIVECIDRDKWTFRSDVDNSGMPLPPTPETPGGPR